MPLVHLLFQVYTNQQPVQPFELLKLFPNFL